MKIIDLLNKIANGEEVPKKIRFDTTYWNRICGEKSVYYINDNDDDLFIYFFRKNLTFTLNDEVEILEEEKKIPEKLDYLGLKIREGNLSKQDVIMLCDYIDYQTQIINQLIDYLKSKGE